MVTVILLTSFCTAIRSAANRGQEEVFAPEGHPHGVREARGIRNCLAASSTASCRSCASPIRRGAKVVRFSLWRGTVAYLHQDCERD